MSTVRETYAPLDSFYSENIENGTARLGLTPENSNMILLQRSHIAGDMPFHAKQVKQQFMVYFSIEG